MSTNLKQQQRTSELSLAKTTWPMIHCDGHGSKSSPNSGPTQENAQAIFAQLDSDVILMLSTPDVIYVQEAINYIKAFNQKTLELINTSPSLDATFPFFAGGTLDNEGYLWYTANNRIARLSPSLNEVVWSERFEPSDVPYNTCCFLPDGNLLVTSCSAAHVVSPQLNEGTFKIVSSLDLSKITWKNQQVYPFYPVMPRPVVDNQGGLYFTSNGFVSKLFYNQKKQEIDANLVWAKPHKKSDASFNLSDAVLQLNYVYAAAKPQDDTAMQIYGFDKTTGEVLGTCIPFPKAIGASSVHCLGGVKEKNILIAICYTEDLSGGMVAIDATSLKVLWHTPIAVIGGAFCCSSVSNRAYIISRDPKDLLLKYWAINLDDGTKTILYQYPSDIDPAVSLSSIGYQGRLYYPNPSPGLTMIQNK